MEDAKWARYATLGGVVLVVLNLVGAAITGEPPAPPLGDNAATFWVLSGILLAASGFGLAVHVGATSILALRTRLFPMWVAYLGLLDALGFLVAGLTGTTTDASGPMIIGLFAFIAYSVWVLALSVAMWRTYPATARAQRVATTV